MTSISNSKLAIFVTVPLSTENKSTGQMDDLFEDVAFLSTLSIGTIISVIATDKHCRIKNETTMPRKAIPPKMMRWGSNEPARNIKKRPFSAKHSS